MQASLVLTGWLMGLAGGPHCVVMCGVACAGIGRAGAPHSARALWWFQAGRVGGYALWGALAAGSMQGLGWLSVYSAALRPVWTLLHVAALVLGCMLLWRARQPVWLEQLARRAWWLARRWMPGDAPVGRCVAPLATGLLWALMPCGLLYAAVTVAALTAQPLAGAAVMAAFAAGTAVALTVAPWLWLRLRGQAVGTGGGQWGVRLAGLALMAVSGWVLWSGLVQATAPWCSV